MEKSVTHEGTYKWENTEHIMCLQMATSGTHENTYGWENPEHIKVPTDVNYAYKWHNPK